MNERERAKSMIRTLERKGFYAECPCCEEPVRLSDCELFYLDEFTESSREVLETMQEQAKARADDLRKLRKQISARSEIGSKAVNLGFIFERLAPSLPGFRFERTDCRSLFDPIDYVIFEGLSTKGEVSRIIFSDIKTGSASLQQNQKQIRSAIHSKKLSVSIYDRE